jgi:hypothetical protein
MYNPVKARRLFLPAMPAKCQPAEYIKINNAKRLKYEADYADNKDAAVLTQIKSNLSQK